MASIIEQIQRDALDESVSVSSLLRRVKFAAAKLNLDALEDWVERELSGYQSIESIPSYRIVHGRPMAQNPVRGWEPIGGATEALSKRYISQSLASLEELIRGAEQPGATIHFPFSDEVAEKLNSSNGVHGWLVTLEVDKSLLRAISDQVRTRVLDWSLKMEKAGVKGSEFDFDSSEKTKAQAATTSIHIGSIGAFTGNLGSGNLAGDISVGDIEVGRVGDLISAIESHVHKMGLSEADVLLLEAKLGEVKTAIAEAAPGSVIRGLLADVKSILVRASGSLVATGALTVLHAMLGTGVPPT